jgi:hypothetical protein
MLRKVLPYLLALAFVWQSMHGLWTLCSFFIQQDYIAQNLCENRFDKLSMCNGQCYLEKQLKEDGKQEQKLPTIKQQESFCLVHEQKEEPENLFQLQEENSNFTENRGSLASAYLQSIDQPPEI